MDVTVSGCPVRGIIFDKDGTLFDFSTTWEAWAAAFLCRAACGDEERAQRAGAAIGFDLACARFLPKSIVIAGTPIEIASELNAYFPDLSFDELVALLNDEAAHAPQAEAVPLKPLLTTLRARGLALGVATNDAEAPARAHLQSAGVDGFFDFIAGSDSGFGGKPAPGQLLAFCADTGLAAKTVVMVGDSTHDLHAGRAAGMSTVGVLTGMAPLDVLVPHADIVLSDIGALPDWLDQLATV
ncbi:HAD family hydrolase [uncultured Tateyamaria sp.]|uniref:HAD family hydrolase n=1 Tax=uncultured Tateyamaria sp. TaxID=455651 RepID=UPI00261FBD50|nr:HAD family hydrolase [uncultured Tateyamaria sp.]